MLGGLYDLGEGYAHVRVLVILGGVFWDELFLWMWVYCVYIYFLGGVGFGILGVKLNFRFYWIWGIVRI